MKFGEMWWDLVRFNEILRYSVKFSRFGQILWDSLPYDEISRWDMVRFCVIWWDFVTFCESWWDLAGFDEILWDSMSFYEIWWDLIRFCEIWWDLVVNMAANRPLWTTHVYKFQTALINLAPKVVYVFQAKLLSSIVFE